MKPKSLTRNSRPVRISGAYPADSTPISRTAIRPAQRIPVTLIHPNGIERIGIHYSWSTSRCLHVQGVAATYEEARLSSTFSAVRVGVLVLADTDTEPDVSEGQNAAIIRKVVPSPEPIRWIVLARQPSMLCSEAARIAGAAAYFDQSLTSEQIESAVTWVDSDRCFHGETPVWQLDVAHRA